MIQQVESIAQSLVSQSQNTNTLGSETFLNLLVTQLKNQNPLEPMESTQFVTQLAQFSELDQVRQLNTSQSALLSYMASLNNFTSLNLMGKEVEYSGDTVTLADGTVSDIRYRLPSEASEVSVVISDATGKTVRTLNQGHELAGVQTLSWDGRDDQGKELADGTYTYKVTAKDASGSALAVETINKGRVAGVEFRDGQPYLNVDGRWLSLAEILGITG